MRSIVLIITFCLIALCGLPADAQDQRVEPYRYWDTNWSFESIDLQDLTTRIRGLGIPIPVKLSGRANVQFKVSVPLNGLRTPEAYRVSGTIAATRLKVDDVQLESVTADVDYRQGLLTLKNLQGRQVQGTFSGTASAKLVPTGQFEASITTEELRVDAIAKLMQKFGVISQERPIQAAITAAIKATGKVDQLGSPETWSLTGNASVDHFSIGDSNRYSVTIEDFQLLARRLNVPRLQLVSEDLPEFYLKGSANIPLDPDESFQLAIEANDLPATDLLGLYFDSPRYLVDGKLDVRGELSGQIGDGSGTPNLNANLAIASPALRVAGVDLGLIEHDVHLSPTNFHLQPRQGGGDQLQIHQVHADYQITPQAFDLSSLRADIFGGSLKGSVRLARRKQGKHVVQAKWENVSPRIRLPTPLSQTPLVLATQTSGSLDWSVPADKLDQPIFHDGIVEIQINPVRMGAESLGDFAVKFAVNRDGIDLQASGNLFGGRLNISGQSPLTTESRWQQIPTMLLPTTIVLNDLALGRVLSFVSGRSKRFGGRINGQVELSVAEDRSIATQSNVVVSGWTSGNMLIAEQLAANLTTLGTQIDVNSVTGTYAGGRLQATGKWSLGKGARLLTFRLTRGDANHVLLPLSDSASNWFDGIVSGRGTLVGGQSLASFRVTGALTVEDGSTFGFPVGDAHTAYHGQYSASPNRWRVTFPTISAELARGRINGKLEFASTSSGRRGYQMDSHWRINHVNFESLLSQHVGTSTFGRGVVTGTCQLSGRDISSLRDLNGEYRFRLGGTDATAIPGLADAGSLLGVTSLAGARFTSGETKGRIARGNLLIDSAKMTADRLAVSATGRVNLQNRQMDLLTIVSVGGFPEETQLLSSLGSQVLLEAAPIVPFNRLISDRTLVMEMIGPVRDPVIRPLPAETLRANTRRFIVQQGVGLLVADSLLWDN